MRPLAALPLILTAACAAGGGGGIPAVEAQRAYFAGTWGGAGDKGTPVGAWLGVEYAFVCDNREGCDPCGGGSDRAWYGVAHGPDGNLHVVVHNGAGKEIAHGVLPGPHRTGHGKWEWRDNEEMHYDLRPGGYRIADWAQAGSERLYVHIWESDPGPFRDHDTLARFSIDRTASLLAPVEIVVGDGACCAKPTTFRLRTVQ